MADCVGATKLHHAQGHDLGFKIFDRYKEHGLEALTDRSRRRVRYANQLPQQPESLIVRLKVEKPHWGARKKKTVQPLDNPIGTRLSPMSQVQSVTHVSGMDPCGLAETQGFEPWIRL